MTNPADTAAYTPSAFALEMISRGAFFECPCGEPMYTAQACFNCRKCRVYAEGATPFAFDYRTGEIHEPEWLVEARAARAVEEARQAAVEARNHAGLSSGFSQLSAALGGKL